MMKKLIILLLFIPLISCSDSASNKDSTLMITNSSDASFTFNQISFCDYEFSNLDLKYGESQTYNLNNLPRCGAAGSTMIAVQIIYKCGGEAWTSNALIDFDKGSQTSINFQSSSKECKIKLENGTII